MSQRLKNIIIFFGIALGAILVSLFFFQEAPNEDNLTPSFQTSTSPAGVSAGGAGQDFLPLLLNVRNIKLNDAIFLDTAFQSLVDSSIALTPEGNEGRFNPFAPFGVENRPTSSP